MKDYYITNTHIDIPNIMGPDGESLPRLQAFSSILADPASLHAVVLVAASHYTRARDPNSRIINLLRLRDMAIREIRGALLDDRRGTSDPLITAVAYLASYEVVFGSRATCQTHMDGLTAMVVLHGGLSALGFEGFLEHIVRWTDSNASGFTGSRSPFDKGICEPFALHATPVQLQATCPASGETPRRIYG
jgi:hypothetical protein